MANKRLISVDGMCAWRALVIKSCFFLGDRFGDYLLKLIVCVLGEHWLLRVVSFWETVLVTIC